MASRTLCASEPWGPGTTQGYALEGSQFGLCQAQTHMGAPARVRFPAPQQDPVGRRQNSQDHTERPVAPSSAARAPRLVGTVPESCRAHLNGSRKGTDSWGRCSSCLDTPPPLLVHRSGPPESESSGAAQTARLRPLQGIPSAVLGEQRPRSAPASPSCPKMLVTAPGCALYLCCLQGKLGTHEVQSCPHFVGAQQSRGSD